MWTLAQKRKKSVDLAMLAKLTEIYVSFWRVELLNNILSIIRNYVSQIFTVYGSKKQYQNKVDLQCQK